MPFFSNSSVLRNAEGERHGSSGNGNRSPRKIPPLEGRVASGVSRKPDDGRGDFRCAFASVERYCFSIRHLFRRLRRHLPLKGKDLGAELVPFLRPSERTAIRYDTSSVACGDTFPSRGRTGGQTSFRFRVRRGGLLIDTTPLPSPAAPPSPRGEGLGAGRLLCRTTGAGTKTAIGAFQTGEAVV